MVRVSKRRKAFSAIAKEGQTYSLDEAIGNIENFPKTKFNETVELHLALNIDLKASDQGIRGTVILPHGTGKNVRIAVICKGEDIQVAEGVGAEFVGDATLIEKIANGFMDFDCVVATPDMMRDLSKLGKILGPRGLMPSPKAGTVTKDIARVVKEVKAGRVEFKSDKQAGVHVGVGKRSFSKDQLRENIQYLLDAIEHAKPSSVKGALIKSMAISTTMGPGLRIAV